MGNQKLKWTVEEEDALLAGVAKHGPGKWKNILKDPEFSDQLSSRSNIDLKDKWRNLSVAPGIQGSKDKIRTPKIKAAALHLAAVAAAATSTPTPTPNSTQTTFLTRSASDLSMDDRCNIVVDAKNAPRYDGMIFEALSALANANGSDIGTIFTFIEQRHEVPPNFRRSLSSRLGRLANGGKLVKIQNSYKLKDNAMGTRVLIPSPRVEDVTVQPQQTNNQGPIVSQDMIKKASERAAQLIAEAENKSYELREAMEEYERMVKIADEYDIFLEIVKEMQEACSLGKSVILGTSTGTIFERSLE